MPTRLRLTPSALATPFFLRPLPPSPLDLALASLSTFFTSSSLAPGLSGNSFRMPSSTPVTSATLSSVKEKPRASSSSSAETVLKSNTACLRAVCCSSSPLRASSSSPSGPDEATSSSSSLRKELTTANSWISSCWRNSLCAEVSTCSLSRRRRSPRSRTASAPAVRWLKSLRTAASSWATREANLPTVRPEAMRACHWLMATSACVRPAV
mmetsp:Transcript_7969/g.17298  ORF Transcript_7969/g.17298 Transcript_7969/m.17298 type:complete len:211 (-) Transcript_7969:877-1509(-)